MSEIHYAPQGAEPGTARRAMIESQLRTSGVNESWVLTAIARVAREDFVPVEQRATAYIDRAIPLPGGRAIPAPLFAGKSIAAAEPTKADKALVVSAGSGYLAEVLRPLVGSLDVVDAANVAALPGSGYSLILIDGAAGEVPQTLVDALAADGRIITGLFTKSVSHLALGRKSGASLTFVNLSDIGIPAIPEFAAPKRWSF
jgi:protein-L-isoaspartate(D-aspartate) O-methyltransferase